MAKTREENLRDLLGAQLFQIAILTADLEAAREEIAQLKAAKAPVIDRDVA